jgi:nucleoside triphosphate diphosphatase
MTPSRDIGRLLEIMAVLRTPGTGCPWDLAQNFSTIAPYTLEEAYEVADAITRDDMADLKEELGDLLLQVVYHARMAEERGAFSFGDVVQAITEKMIRRHPHVFGDMAGELQAHGLQSRGLQSRGLQSRGLQSRGPQAVEGLWDRIKTQEKQDKAAGNNAGTANGALAGVPVALPALTRALKLQTNASKVGFDWNDPRAVLRKIREETDEIEAELDNPLPNPPPQAGEGWVGAAAAEVGDLLFAAVNLARHLRADPEAVLRETNRKFERRFASIEKALAARGKAPQDSTLAEMDALWDAAKRSE